MLPHVNSANAMNKIASVIISLRLDVALQVGMLGSVLLSQTNLLPVSQVYLVVCVKEDHDSEQFGPKSAGFVGKVREKFVVLILLSQSLIPLSVPARSATGSLSARSRRSAWTSVCTVSRSCMKRT